VSEKVTFVILDQDPEVVRDQVSVWLENQPWVERVEGSGPFVGNPRVKAVAELKTTFAGWGFAVNVILTLLTFGSWAVVAGGYYLYRVLVEPGAVIINFYHDGGGNTRVVAEPQLLKQSYAAEYLSEIEAYPASEYNAEKLKESRAGEAPQQTPPTPNREGLATRRPTARTDKGPLYEPSAVDGRAGDIPSQIERLAELRDAGVITAEDFDEKKRDLLDRM
jgi:hypothetical protein